MFRWTVDKKMMIGAWAIMLAALFRSVDGIRLRPKFYALPVELVVFLEHTLWLLVLMPFLLKSGRQIHTLSKKDWFAVVRISVFGWLLGTLLITKAFFLAFAWSITLATVVLLQKLQPVFALLGARIILKEKLPKTFYIRAILAIAAGYVLAFAKDWLVINYTDLRHNGALFSFLAAFAFGSSTIFGKSIVNKLDVTLTTWMRFGLTSILALILVLITGNMSSIASISWLQWGFLAIIVCSSGVTAMFLYYFGLHRVTASQATILELFRPLSAVILDYIINGNILTLTQIGASIVLLFAFFQIIRIQKKDATVFTATVIHGRGRWLQTANLDKKDLAIEHGVYAVDVLRKKKKYAWLMHFGYRPSLHDSVSTEVILQNFSEDLYGETIKVYIHKKIRDIVAFDSTEELEAQIKKDWKAV